MYATAQDGILQPGVIAKLGETVLPEPSSYIDEVNKFLQGSRDAYGFPFVNQDRTFRSLVSYLAHSPYPYAVLVGEPGIGKSMMTDHLLGMLDEKVAKEGLERVAPDLVDEVELLKSRLSQFEHRDYMILPNLRRPRDPVVLAYKKGRIEKSLQIVTEYNRAMAALLMNYFEDNNARMRLRFSPEGFGDYCRSKIAEFYVAVYGFADEMTKKEMTQHLLL